MGTLEICLFGTLRLQCAEEPVLPLPTRRSRELLSYLLINRRMLCPREQVAALFWPDMDDQRARHCLNTALWRLQRAVGQSTESSAHPYLRIDSQNIGFNLASNFRLDVEEFESRCNLAKQAEGGQEALKAELYRQAVELYRADLLIDCYEDWCLVERDRLQRLYVHALNYLVGYHQANCEYERAIDYAHRILAIDPTLEEAHRKLMELQIADSQPAAALRQYHACVETLGRELGVDPMPETRALLPRILGGSSTGLVSVGGGRQTLREHPDPTSVLLDAVAHLEEAIASFDRASQQISGATMIIQELAQELSADPPHLAGRRLVRSHASTAADLAGVTQLLGQLTRQLTMVRPETAQLRPSLLAN